MKLLFVSLAQLLEVWNGVFFSDGPTLTICIFRMLTGMLVISDVFSWARHYTILLAPDGWLGYDSYEQHLHATRFSLFNYLPASSKSYRLVLALQLIGGIGLVMGVFPTLAALICFITLVSIHNRNPYVLSGGDTVHRFFCLFLIFAPSGTQLSLLAPNALLRPDAAAWPWTLVLIRLFVANIYLKNVLFKLLGESWRRGTATQQVLQVRIWNRRKLPAVLDQTWLYRATTYGTLLVETALFSLIWVDEFRLSVIAAGVLLHVGIWVFLKLGFFQSGMIVGLLTFIEPHEYERIFRWVVYTVS